MTTKSLLTTDHLPQAFQLADQRAVAAQQKYLWVIKVQIAGLLIPAILGPIDVAISGPQPVLSLFSVLSLTVVAATRLIQRFSGYDSAWHSSRAQAETIRSLCWRFVAPDSDFQGMSDERASAELGLRVESLSDERRAEHEELDLVTKAMTDLRSSPFETRRRAYAEGRLQSQLVWYRERAAKASKRSRLWDWLFVGSAGLAVVFGIARVSGSLEVNLVSLFGLTAAVIGTWTGVNQFGSLHTTYSNTAQELEDLNDVLPDVVVTFWPDFVTKAEEVMAREHSIWLFRRR